MSIRAWIMALVLSATILPLVLAVFHFLADREAALKDAERAISSIALATARDLEDKIRGTSQLLYGLGQARYMDSEDRETCSKFLAEVLQEQPQYTGILTIRPDASLFCDSLRSGRELNLADRAYFQKALRQPSGVAVEPVFGRLTGLSVLQIAHPVRDEKGMLRFVLLASLNLAQYMETISRSPAYSSMVFMLVDRQGMVLTRHPVIDGAVGTSLATTPLFELAKSLANGAIGEESGIDGNARVWSVSRLPVEMDTGIHILVGVARADLAAAANRNLIYGISVLSILMILVMLAAWALGEYGIHRQFVRITRVANRLAGGDLTARIEPPFPSGSIGGLMRSINHSAEMLESHRLRIEELNERFTAVIKSSPAAILCIDSDGVVTLWNATAETIFGYSAAEAIGLPPPYISEEQRTAFAGLHRRALQGITIEDGEATATTKDGRIINIAFRSAPIRSSDDARPEVVFVISDVTEQRALEQQLRQAQKMEAVGQLTGGIAHDFNNLLTVILGNSEALVELLPSGSPAHSLAEITVRASVRGAELTNSLLAFSRLQALAPRVVDVNAMLQQMEGLLQRTLGEHIEIKLIARASWRAMVDQTQMETAILNLAVNARDAMPTGGHLSIETDNVVLDDTYASTNVEVPAGDYVMIAVTDTGTGMTPEVIAHAFEPFFTTKDVGKGSGLGLSMVYGFVKQSGGHLKIYSEVGQGTTFKVYLPRATDETGKAITGSEAPDMLRGNEAILVVEDDDLVRVHVERQLSTLGYRVTVAPDGATALDILRGNTPFDLLFTDVVMPGRINGPTLVREALGLRPNLKVLYTSGYTENAIVHHGRIDANVQLLSKPYRLLELATKVREVIHKPEAT